MKKNFLNIETRLNDSEDYFKSINSTFEQEKISISKIVETSENLTGSMLVGYEKALRDILSLSDFKRYENFKLSNN